MHFTTKSRVDAFPPHAKHEPICVSAHNVASCSHSCFLVLLGGDTTHKVALTVLCCAQVLLESGIVSVRIFECGMNSTNDILYFALSPKVHFTAHKFVSQCCFLVTHIATSNAYKLTLGSRNCLLLTISHTILLPSAT